MMSALRQRNEEYQITLGLGLVGQSEIECGHATDMWRPDIPDWLNAGVFYKTKEAMYGVKYVKSILV